MRPVLVLSVVLVPAAAVAQNAPAACRVREAGVAAAAATRRSRWRRWWTRAVHAARELSRREAEAARPRSRAPSALSRMCPGA